MLTTNVAQHTIFGIERPFSELIKKKGPFQSPAQEAYLNLWRTSALLGVIQDAFFEEFGLTGPQYNILRILRGEHPASVSMGEIKRRLVTPQPDLTRLVDRLVRKKLAVRIVPEGNRRLVLIIVTPEGLSLLERMDRPLVRMHERQVGHLSAQELECLNRLLDEVRSSHEGE